MREREYVNCGKMVKSAFHLRKLFFGTIVVFGVIVIAYLLIHVVSTAGKSLITYSQGDGLLKIRSLASNILTQNTSKSVTPADMQQVLQDSNPQQEVGKLPGLSNNVRVFNASKESPETRDAVSKHQCVRLRTPGRETKICVHPRERDIYVSGSLISSGMWEGNLVALTARSMAIHPGMTLLDLGCNVGTYTLCIAAMGRRVVSIDANKENLLLLTRSLDMDTLYDNVTLVWNAMSDVHENVILKGYKENKGGTYVQPTNQTDVTDTVRTTMLDDLVPLFGKNESIFIKMDIETYEWNALNGGWNFFKSLKVGYVLMEFSSHKKSESGNKICVFMTGFGFRPYNMDGHNPLVTSQYENWPGNVFWKKE